MTNINFTTLSDAFAALMLAARGEKVILSMPEKLWHLRGGVIMCRFLEEGIFCNDGAKGLFDYRQLTSAAESLHTISPNTVYPEAVYAVQEKNFLRDFANHFRQKAYRDISKPDDNVTLLRDGVAMRIGKVLRCAPAYRINYQRLVVAILRTLRNLGSDYKIINEDSAPIDGNCTKYQYFRLDASMSPTVWKSVYLPSGVWLYSRSNDFYILVKSGVDVVSALSEVFDGFQLPKGALQNPLEIALSDLDLPFEALLSASQKNDFELSKMPALDGGNFEFSPSMADVVGYADYYFDMVKRLDINVHEFRDAVFDYGTHIEEIVNDTYDLYPEYHNGVKAFRAAVAKWREQEI